MAEYIDRTALLESLQETEKKLSELYDTAGTQDMANSCYGQRIMLIECILRIKEQPTADVAPVRHARWFWGDDGFCRCSDCTQKSPFMPQYQDEPITTMTEFCPHCGSLMDGGTDNGE